MVYGSGDYTYELVEGWGGGAAGRDLGVVSSMAVDSQDRVHVIDREPDPAIVVYDRNGRFLYDWGQDVFKVPHSLSDQRRRYHLHYRSTTAYRDDFYP